jgi:hypothetical protein
MESISNFIAAGLALPTDKGLELGLEKLYMSSNIGANEQQNLDATATKVSTVGTSNGPSVPQVSTFTISCPVCCSCLLAATSAWC